MNERKKNRVGNIFIFCERSKTQEGERTEKNETNIFLALCIYAFGKKSLFFEQQSDISEVRKMNATNEKLIIIPATYITYHLRFLILQYVNLLLKEIVKE